MILPKYSNFFSVEALKLISFRSVKMDKDQVNKILEGLQNDLKALILETRKKYTSVKEVTIQLFFSLHINYGILLYSGM